MILNVCRTVLVCTQQSTHPTNLTADTVREFHPLILPKNYTQAKMVSRCGRIMLSAMLYAGRMMRKNKNKSLHPPPSAPTNTPHPQAAPRSIGFAFVLHCMVNLSLCNSSKQIPSLPREQQVLWEVSHSPKPQRSSPAPKNPPALDNKMGVFFACLTWNVVSVPLLIFENYPPPLSLSPSLVLQTELKTPEL